jgi:hypothetical protein
MFASAATPEMVETALRTAHSKLKIIVAPVMKIEDERPARS